LVPLIGNFEDGLQSIDARERASFLFHDRERIGQPIGDRSKSRLGAIAANHEHVLWLGDHAWLARRTGERRCQPPAVRNDIASLQRFGRKI
jgi:hypothetical protein